MEFAVKYDDGVGAGLDEADIVLVGVSRTSKTPLSIYLGYLGHKVANVPVVKGIKPPKELFEINPAKIVGLNIHADRLADIRRARARTSARTTGATRGWGRSTTSSRRRGRSTAGSVAPSSTSRSSRSRRRRSASCGRSRAARPRLRRAKAT